MSRYTFADNNFDTILTGSIGSGNRCYSSMTIPPNEALLAMFIDHQRGARGFSEYTIRRRLASLKGLSRWVQPQSLADVETVAIEAWIGSLQSPRTKHAYLSDAAMFYQWAVRRGVASHDPTVGVESVRIPKGLPRPVPCEAVKFIISSAPSRHMRVGLALATYAGLRRSEVVNLTTDDISLISSPPILTVRSGKFGKDRHVPIHAELSRHLARQSQGRIVPLSPDEFGRRAAAHMRACGFDYTAHDLRATFATELARISKGNVLLVGKLLGHESTQTTMLYIGLAGYAGAEHVGNMYPA